MKIRAPQISSKFLNIDPKFSEIINNVRKHISQNRTQSTMKLAWCISPILMKFDIHIIMISDQIKIANYSKFIVY